MREVFKARNLQKDCGNHFQQAFMLSANLHDKLFLQDSNLNQNSTKAVQVFENTGAEVFLIPPRRDFVSSDRLYAFIVVLLFRIFFSSFGAHAHVSTAVTVYSINRSIRNN